MVQLEHVHTPDGRLLVERLAGASVEELDLAAARHVREDLTRTRRNAPLLDLGQSLVDVRVRLVDRLVDLPLGAAVKDRRHRLEPEQLGRPTQMHLEDLPHVHAAGHTQRVEHDLDGRAVLHEGHVLLGNDASNHTLVAVTAGHLVANRKRTLHRDVDLDHLEDARRQLVAPLLVSYDALLLDLDRLHARPLEVVDLLRLLARLLRALDPLQIEGVDLLEDDLGDLAGAHTLTRERVDHLGADDLIDGLDHLAEALDRLRVHLGLVLLDLLVQLPLLLLGEVHAAAELLGPDHHAGRARGHLERVVLHVLARATEDRVQQLLFRRQLGLGLGRNLADQDVTRADAGADTDDAVVVEVAQHLL